MNLAVQVLDYQASWPAAFEAAASQLAQALGDAGGALHHIGSTSVPGLAAKPIIDMLVEVRALEDVAQKEAADGLTQSLPQMGQGAGIGAVLDRLLAGG